MDMPSEPLANAGGARASAFARSNFASLIAPLIDPAHRLAIVMLRDPDDASDAVQESALKAWRKWHQLRSSDPRQWFLAIVVRQCQSMRRRSWHSILNLDPNVAATSQYEDRIVARTDLGRALARLHPKYRLVLFLHFNLDLPVPSVARTLNLSVPATKSRLHRAIEQLRPYLIAVPEEP